MFKANLMFMLSINIFVFVLKLLLRLGNGLAFFSRITIDHENNAASSKCVFGPRVLPTSTMQNNSLHFQFRFLKVMQFKFTKQKLETKTDKESSLYFQMWVMYVTVF